VHPTLPIIVHRVVLARGPEVEHNAVERELWHHDFRCPDDAKTFADRLRRVPPVIDGREHVDVQVLEGDASDPRFIADEVLDRFVGGGR
jgi:hypothetical protein